MKITIVASLLTKGVMKVEISHVIPSLQVDFVGVLSDIGPPI